MKVQVHLNKSLKQTSMVKQVWFMASLAGKWMKSKTKYSFSKSILYTETIRNYTQIVALKFIQP